MTTAEIIETIAEEMATLKQAMFERVLEPIICDQDEELAASILENQRDFDERLESWDPEADSGFLDEIEMFPDLYPGHLADYCTWTTYKKCLELIHNLKLEVVVDTSGGVVNDVACTENTLVTVVDWDNIDEGKDPFPTPGNYPCRAMESSQDWLDNLQSQHK